MQLFQKGCNNCGEVGRHVMGSQVFDYWSDASDDENWGRGKEKRFILEHYVDVDLVNETTEAHWQAAAPGNLHVWGPEVPGGFMR